MKLRWYDRILVALSGLVLMALGVCVILAAGGVITLPEAIAFDTWLGDGWQWMPIVFLAGALLFIWGLWLLIRPFRRGSEHGGKYYTLQSEEDGNVRISVNAIDNLVHRAIDAYPQIVSSKVRIGGQEDAMEITLHLTLHSDVRIPELVEELRADIKQSLQHSAGVTVKTVQIYVDATKAEKGDQQDVKYIEAKNRAMREEPAADFINTTNFYTTPVVVTGDSTPEEPITKDEPTVAELKEEIDLGPDEPLPVKLSEQAFPFPEKEAGVPLEIFTADVPIKDDTQGDGEDE